MRQVPAIITSPRVMVYDVSGNFVGDTHWQNAESIQDGDELKLDKGVIIQVAEETGRKEQDLSELLERKITGKEDSPVRRRHQYNGSRYPVPSTSSDGRVTARKPKSIRSILTENPDTPRKSIGNSMPPSPWQRDTVEVAIRVPDSKTKRRKIAHQASRHPLPNSEATFATNVQKHSRPVVQTSVIPNNPNTTVQHHPRNERPPSIVPKHLQSKTSSIQAIGRNEALEMQEEPCAKSLTVRGCVAQDNVQRHTTSPELMPYSEDESVAFVEAQKPLQRLESKKRQRKKLICQDPEHSKGRPSLPQVRNERPNSRQDGESVSRQDSIMVTGSGVAKTSSAVRVSQDTMPDASLGFMGTELAQVRCSDRIVEPPQKRRQVQNEADLGPWSREAFDLFGWQQGHPKKFTYK